MELSIHNTKDNRQRGNADPQSTLQKMASSFSYLHTHHETLSGYIILLKSDKIYSDWMEDKNSNDME